MGETHRAAQDQRQKTNCCGKCAKKNRAAKFCHRRSDGLLIFLAIKSGLLVAAEDQDRKVDAESDQNRTETDRDHAQPSEDQQPGCKCDQTREQK